MGESGRWSRQEKGRGGKEKTKRGVGFEIDNRIIQMMLGKVVKLVGLYRGLTLPPPEPPPP